MITIVGGSGFVGSRLIESLDLSNCMILDKNPSPFFNNQTTIGNIVSKEQIVFAKNTKAVVLLAAEHRDDVSPTSLYYDVNVKGTQNVLDKMDSVGVKHLIFTSSVAIYGLDKYCPDETRPEDPFNHYGKSKWQAEQVIKEWFEKDPVGKSVTIIRPTVIFGERNRGNVYNLLKQISLGKFFMIGKGQNKKSMAYVGNVVAFIKHRLELAEEGYHIFNYVDKPDLTITSLLGVIEKSLNKKIPSIRIPVWLGYLGGYGFDFLAFLTRKKLAVSSVRVKKFVATTQFDASKVHSSGFKAPFTLEEGLNKTLDYEFVNPKEDDVLFYSE
ncbi:MAG: NAD-dependent epimerase/dehydratase family protein [Flavobacteriaceae bacterium]